MTTTNGSAPLRLARSLFSDIAHPSTNLSEFSKHLSAIHSAAYLLLLPQTCRAEVDHHRREATRISTGPLGDAVLHATTLFLLNSCRHETARTHHADMYEATGRMLSELAAEESRYLDNMTLLLASVKGKWKEELIETGSWHHTALTMGKSGIASAQALADLVGDRATAPPPPQPHDDDDDDDGRYLGEIAQYWRKWTRGGEARAYEEVWSYVAGRTLVQE